MTEIENAVYEIMLFINLNLFEPITLDVLSHRFAYSKYYIHREFKAVAGMTINEYMKKRRIEHSLYFLFTNIDASITEVAEYCGFSSAVYSREFKKVFNRSPRQWRNVYKKSGGSPQNSKICKNYERFIDYTDHGIPKEIQKISVIRENRRVLKAVIIYGDYTMKIKDYGDMLRACNSDHKPYIGIPINSPAVTDLGGCLFVLGFESGLKIPGLNDVVIEEGDYIELQFSGPRGKIGEALTWLFKYDMPQRRLKHDYRVQFIQYHDFPDFSDSTVSCEIYIPCAYY